MFNSFSKPIDLPVLIPAKPKKNLPKLKLSRKTEDEVLPKLETGKKQSSKV